MFGQPQSLGRIRHGHSDTAVFVSVHLFSYYASWDAWKAKLQASPSLPEPQSWTLSFEVASEMGIFRPAKPSPHSQCLSVHA